MKLKTTPYFLDDVKIQDGQFHPSRLTTPSDANGEIRLESGCPGTCVETRLPSDSNYWEWAQKFIVTAKLGIYGIRVSVVGATPLAGGGVMCDEDLYERCPHCKSKDCVIRCDHAETGDETLASRNRAYQRAMSLRMKRNASIDAILNLILSHAVAGVDIEKPAYLEGIDTAIMYVGQAVDQEVKWFDRANPIELRRFFECGGCDHHHPFGWSGDCRDDGQRYSLDRLDKTYGERGWVEVYESTGLPSGGVYGADNSEVPA